MFDPQLLDGVTPALALQIVIDGDLSQIFLMQRQVPSSQRRAVCQRLWELAEVAMAEEAARKLSPPPAKPTNPHRADEAALRELVARVRLPPRMREVARLCLEEGLTLDACARQLEISRETVRVHLRRLRAQLRPRGATAPAERSRRRTAARAPGPARPRR